MNVLAALLFALLAGAGVGVLTGMFLQGLNVESLVGFLVSVTAGVWIVKPAYRMATKRLGQK